MGIQIQYGIINTCSVESCWESPINLCWISWHSRQDNIIKRLIYSSDPVKLNKPEIVMNEQLPFFSKKRYKMSSKLTPVSQIGSTSHRVLTSHNLLPKYTCCHIRGQVSPVRACCPMHHPIIVHASIPTHRSWAFFCGSSWQTDGRTRSVTEVWK